MVLGVPVFLSASPLYELRLALGILRRSANCVVRRSYAPLRGFGIFLEEPFKFADPINRAVGDATRA